MARADSTIRVNIIGDAKSLQKAADKSGAAVGGMGKTIAKAGILIGGAFAVDQLVEFGNTAVKEGDRVADAIGRIEGQLGPDLARVLEDRADDFAALGASKGDMLELEARIIDIGTAAGIAGSDLGPFAEDAAEVAHAMALATDIPADEWINKIGKAAASGDARSLRDLGVNLSGAAVNAQALADTGKSSADALTEQEKAAARAHLIIGNLSDRYGDVNTVTGDLEQKQSELNAKFETLAGEIGPAVEDVLEGILDFVLKGVDGWQLFAEWVGNSQDELKEFAGPAARAADLINAIADAFWTLIDAIQSIPDLPGWFGDQLSIGGGAPRRRGGTIERNGTVNVTVQGGSPEAIERAVRDAVRTTARRG